MNLKLVSCFYRRCGGVGHNKLHKHVKPVSGGGHSQLPVITARDTFVLFKGTISFFFSSIFFLIFKSVFPNIYIKEISFPNEI